MVLSTETGALRRLVGDRKAIEILASAGFDALDYSFGLWMETEATPWVTDSFEKYAKEITAIAEGCGVYFNQAHAPFAFNMALLPHWEQEILPLNIRCIEACALLGIPHMVVHPVHHLPYAKHREDIWKLNEQYFNMLLPYAKQFGVKVCLENMFGKSERCAGVYTKDMLSDPYEYARFYDSLGNDDSFICCVDTGHSGLAGEDPAETIRVLGKRVKALHINDNDYKMDSHLIPYQGKIDWEDVMKALAEIGYDGDMTLEPISLYQGFRESFYPTVAKYLHDVGRYLIELYDQYRAKRYLIEEGRN